MVPEGFGELVAPAADYGLWPDQTFVQVHFDEPVQHHRGQASYTGLISRKTMSASANVNLEHSSRAASSRMRSDKGASYRA